LDKLELRVHRVKLEIRELQAHKERLALQELKEILETPVTLAHRETPVQLEMLE
jgi:hypothetical protein